MSQKLECHIPPVGWKCTREAGHDGPCAAYPDAMLVGEPQPSSYREPAAIVSWAANRLVELEAKAQSQAQRIAELEDALVAMLSNVSGCAHTARAILAKKGS